MSAISDYTEDFISEWISSVKNRSLKVLPTGSTVICNTPLTDTDIDFLVLSSDTTLGLLETFLVENQYLIGGSFSEPLSTGPNNKFYSYKRTFDFDMTGLSPFSICINFIITLSPHLFINFKKATNLAKQLNLVNKLDRIALFQAVCNNKWPHLVEEIV